MRHLFALSVLLVIVVVSVYLTWGSFSWQRQIVIQNPEEIIATLQAVEGATVPTPPTFATASEVGFLAPDFSLQNLENTDVRLSDYLGRTVILTFWTTRCPFCVNQLDALGRLATLRKNTLVVIAINQREPIDVIQKFINTRPNLNLIKFLPDTEDVVSIKYDTLEKPRTFFIDEAGVIRAIAKEELTLEGLEGELESLEIKSEDTE